MGATLTPKERKRLLGLWNRGTSIAQRRDLGDQGISFFGPEDKKGNRTVIATFAKAADAALYEAAYSLLGDLLRREHVRERAAEIAGGSR